MVAIVVLAAADTTGEDEVRFATGDSTNWLDGSNGLSV